MNEWYCLYTKFNQEAKVAAVLDSRSIETYLPQIARLERGSRPASFFPCYLFANIDLQTTTFNVRWTPGLRYIVEFDGSPARVPQHLLDIIRSAVTQQGSRSTRAEHSFAPGDPVQFTQGPLQGMVAKMADRQASAHDRVQVLLSMLGQVRQLEVDSAHLERVSNDAAIAGPRPRVRRERRTRGRGRRC